MTSAVTVQTLSLIHIWLTVNRTILYRRELVGCADDLVNRIGKTWAVYTVHDDRAYSQLSIQRLIPTLSVDDMGQPVEGIAVVVTLTCCLLYTSRCV